MIDRWVRRLGDGRWVVVVALALLAVTALVAALETAGVADASPAFFLAVVLVAVVAGTLPAIATAIGAFLLYDFLFIEPRFNFTVADPQEWLNLLLLLLVGLVVGRLAGSERDRAVIAIAREREARALFRVSFALASAPDTAAALSEVVGTLQSETGSERVWIQVGDRVVADSLANDAPPRPPVHVVLSRRPGEQPAEWTRVHAPGGAARTSPDPDTTAYRIAIGAGDRAYGSLWIIRARSAGTPGQGDTRVLAAAADQIGRALDRDRLAEDAAAAEVARRSDILKSALLDSVSHDLRTPLASVRAAAGTLMDPHIEWSPAERREIAASIDREAERLNQLVTNLLDMSRIEAGELRPQQHAFVLDDLVASALERSAARTTGRRIEVQVAPDLPPVEVDDVLFGQVLDNIIDNALRYAGAEATIRIRAARSGEGIRLVVEDDGPGVPDDALPKLFEKFFRVRRSGEGARRGTGMGLAVVEGVMRSMGGSVAAERSELGGLAIVLTVRVARSEGAPAVTSVEVER